MSEIASTAAAEPASARTPGLSRGRIRAEILIVLGLTLGKSAVYAIIKLLERYAAEPAIGSQSTTLNPSRSEIDYFDFAFQVHSVVFGIVPVLLALYLLGASGTPARSILGLTGLRSAWWKDLAKGAGLAAAIGLPGIGLYTVGRAIGQTVRVNTSGLPDLWWSALVLLAAAAVAGLLEETIVVGYLVTRLGQLTWSPVAIIITSAVLRGSYHLYQGWPMALGNVVMGAVFAAYYLRTRRVGPLIVAHWLMDAVAYIGPELAPQSWLDAINGS